jgi:hypothetical protein
MIREDLRCIWLGRLDLCTMGGMGRPGLPVGRIVRLERGEQDEIFKRQDGVIR